MTSHNIYRSTAHVHGKVVQELPQDITRRFLYQLLKQLKKKKPNIKATHTMKKRNPAGKRKPLVKLQTENYNQFFCTEKVTQGRDSERK